jgi:hypothetical protein
LDRRDKRAGLFLGIGNLSKDAKGLLVKIQGLVIVAQDVQGVCLRTQAAAQLFLIAQTARNQNRRFGQGQSLPRVGAQLRPDDVVQLAENGFAIQPAAGEEAIPAHLAGEVRQVLKQFFRQSRLLGPGFHENPTSVNVLRNRSRHRWRMKPIEPGAIPRFCATAW